jgi:hypothetical protein
VSKDAIRQIQLKRSQQYSDDDYARLESLMYDKLDLKLEDAQVEGPFPEIIMTLLMFFAVHPGRGSAVLQKCAKLAR